MAYRNGTYIAFHAQGQVDPSQSDQAYYRLLMAWNENKSIDFKFVNSHDKASSVRDSSKKQTLRNSLMERLRNSKNMLLLLGKTTKFDADWIPFEISEAVDGYRIPIIVCYLDLAGPIHYPEAYREYWPSSLLTRIANNTARAIHVPFKKEPILDAIGQFSHESFPAGGGLGVYNEDAYRSWGLA